MYKFKIYLVFLLSFFLLQISLAASFDCNKARSVSENLICNDPELSMMDEKLFKVYRKAKEISLNSKEFRDEQVQAWKYREKKCVDKECLTEWYVARFKHFNEVVSIESINSSKVNHEKYSNEAIKLPEKKWNFMIGLCIPMDNDDRDKIQSCDPASVKMSNTWSAGYAKYYQDYSLTYWASGRLDKYNASVILNKKVALVYKNLLSSNKIEVSMVVDGCGESTTYAMNNNRLFITAVSPAYGDCTVEQTAINKRFVYLNNNFNPPKEIRFIRFSE